MCWHCCPLLVGVHTQACVSLVLCVFRRNGDSDYSDGEEDFYYSEIEVNMDTLSEGLSNLTPTSPTTSGPAPIFPVLTCDASRSEPAHVIHTPLSQSAPSALCHIRTDHAYQVTSRFSLIQSTGSVLAVSLCRRWSARIILWV